MKFVPRPLKPFWNWAHALPFMRRDGVRFLLAGGLNTLVGYSLYALFILMGLPPLIAVLFSTIIGASFNFFSIGMYVFGRTGRQFLRRFIATYALIYMLNATALHLFISVGGFNNYLAQAFLVPVFAIMSYLLNKYWVFRPQMR